MRRLICIAAALALSTCAPGPGEYKDNDLQLITGYTAKEMCSCLFVMEQPEDFCRAWTRASPAIATVLIDRGDKSVTAGALLLWGARARFVDSHTGCVLQ